MLLLSILCATLSIAFSQKDLLAITEKGPVLGHYTSAGMREWKGIPYAQPPVGALRWAAPQEPSSFAETYVANFDAAGCPQNCNLPPGNCPAYGQSEDCLYLGVMAPSTPAPEGGYPVLFWVHGGAFEQGIGNCALYNGITFAEKGIMTVVVNYRLGALGFMAATTMEGNYGLQDQRLAMQWVATNIAGFGGNPNLVTLAGQSAGAMSAGAHMISSNSKGLFHRVIMESNPLALPFHTRESAGRNADSIMTYLDCAAGDVECMRGKSVVEVLDAQKNAIKLNFDTLLENFLPFAPMVDPSGDIPSQPMEAIGRGEFTAMPVLAGTMVDEGQLFVFELFPNILSEAAYKTIIEGVFGTKAARQILNLYPFAIFPGNVDGRATLNVLATDLLFYCPLRNATRGYENVQRARDQQNKALTSTASPTYAYLFKHVLSFDCWGPDYTFCVGEVCHGSELPFVFNVYDDGEIYYTPTPEERTLGTDLANAWGNFITSGDPNAGSLSIPVPYPQLLTASDSLIVLEEPGSAPESHHRDAYCNLWDTLGYYY